MSAGGACLLGLRTGCPALKTPIPQGQHLTMASGAKGSKDTLKVAILAYLGQHNTMTLATTGDGTPWAAALFYASDGLTFYFLSDPATRHCRNMARNPAVSATINEDYRDWKAIKGIQLEGRAEPVSSPEELARAVAVYAEKYPFVAPYLKLMMTPFPKIAAFLEGFLSKVPFIPSFTAGPTQFYKVVPSKIWFTDNEKGLGHREELEL